MTVKDRVKVEGGEIVRERHYTDRDAVLATNAELQKADAVRPTDGLRPFARFPEGELERLAAKYPTQHGDLVSPDAELRTRAVRKLVNSSDGRPYRVGGTSRKSFFIRNNPLAKDK